MFKENFIIYKIDYEDNGRLRVYDNQFDVLTFKIPAGYFEKDNDFEYTKKRGIIVMEGETLAKKHYFYMFKSGDMPEINLEKVLELKNLLREKNIGFKVVNVYCIYPICKDSSRDNISYVFNALYDSLQEKDLDVGFDINDISLDSDGEYCYYRSYMGHLVSILGIGDSYEESI